jgi:cytochrome c oxidase cbb3-type subunit 3
VKPKTDNMLKRIIKSLFTSLAILAPVLAAAAEKTAMGKGSTMNAMLIGLVALIIVLLFAIGILGNVLRQLAFVYKDKLRKERNKVIAPVALLFIMLLGTAAHAEEAAAAAAPQAPAYISGIAASDFYLLIGIIALEMLVILSMLLSMRVLVRLLSNKPETEKVAKGIIRRPFWDKFNKAVAIEKEQDIMLDHDYDGIQELDNSLPPWWKYGFYLTIVVGVVYIYYYHMGGNGPSSYQEYVAEVEKGEADKAAYLAKSSGNVDENTVKMLDEAGIASGATIFQTACAACHAKDGGGGVGPNLTDEYWLHGGSLSDVFKSIKYGWPDKGMKSWKDDFSPKQIAELTSYIKSIKGTKPAAPKEKQGELYQETASADSTKVVAAK